MKKTIKADDVQIPSDFGKKDVTILAIKTGRRSHDKYLENNLQSFHGNCVIIKSNEVNNPEYQNTAVYKYIFDNDVRITQFSPGARYYLQDRDTKKKYITNHGAGSSWSKFMRAYLEALEETRLKNKE